MAKAKSFIGTVYGSVTERSGDRETGRPGERPMSLLVIHRQDVQQRIAACGACMERRMRWQSLVDATFFFTGAGPKGCINGLAARNIPLLAIALPLEPGTTHADCHPALTRAASRQHGPTEKGSWTSVFGLARLDECSSSISALWLHMNRRSFSRVGATRGWAPWGPAARAWTACGKSGDLSSAGLLEQH
ncbi:uncharacterized protein THITE_117357 [Thermothielavioides terrestris NRRL 8126]|uniref:Uncharacterized protein n=1 Tax=Thermothielavioides terrestris (strain ATCC 38088 / NRRL 8126) TaxID=578455 RepID=G2R609_THETT|nr:uncharacterized protein THITE_117357 [Thermothielavioides terrestris NRRL 8126]AEO68396.1 hypothetical protein THITE_117357 [Thermothielavioides terrestris NRRL 8126]